MAASRTRIIRLPRKLTIAGALLASLAVVAVPAGSAFAAGHGHHTGHGHHAAQRSHGRSKPAGTAASSRLPSESNGDCQGGAGEGDVPWTEGGVLHGVLVIATRSGGTETESVQRGTVTASDSSTITVTSSDGYSTVWTVTTGTKLLPRWHQWTLPVTVGSVVAVEGGATVNGAATADVVRVQCSAPAPTTSTSTSTSTESPTTSDTSTASSSSTDSSSTSSTSSSGPSASAS